MEHRVQRPVAFPRFQADIFENGSAIAERPEVGAFAWSRWTGGLRLAPGRNASPTPIMPRMENRNSEVIVQAMVRLPLHCSRYSRDAIVAAASWGHW